MSLHNNSDYEVISNAEVSSVISKYSPDMIDISLQEILKRKNAPSISPMANMVTSYETNLKIDMAKYPQFQNDMLERRTELYSSIMDKICKYHRLSYQIPSDADIYTCASTMYQFLVSGFYQSCVSFFVNLFTRESKSIAQLINKPDSNATDLSPTNSYVSHRYTGSDDTLAVIHMNMNEVLNVIHSFDIPLQSIIYTSWANSPMATMSELLSSILIDNDKFYNFYLSIADKFRAEIVTDIRLQFMPIAGSIKNYIEEE